MSKQLLTNSRAKDFRACNRLHHLRYNLGYRPAEEAEVLRFGSLWHTGQEAWWLAILTGKPESAWFEDAIAAIRASASDPIDQVKAEELTLGYHLRWKDEGLVPLEVEVEFLCDLVNPETSAASRTFDLAGKIDGIVKDRNGRVLLTERKTSSEDIGVGSEYWRRLTLDPQISTYFRGARSLGHNVEGCIYDVVVKPRLQLYQATPAEKRQYKKTGELYASQRDRDESLDEYRERLRNHIAENPERYYQRGEVVRLPEQEQDAAYDAWQTARLIREAELAGRHVRNPDSCSKYGRTCAFFGICTNTESLDDPTKFRKVEDPHQELLQVGKGPRHAA